MAIELVAHVAGKRKTFSFTSKAIADEFVKSARAKFGSKFKLASDMSMNPQGVPAQVLTEFYPELLHEQVAYPSTSNAPMLTPEITGAPVVELDELGSSIEDAFDTLPRISYVSTSPSGSAMVGVKPLTLEGQDFRGGEARGPSFMEEFHAVTQGIPGNLLASKQAGADEKKQFAGFLKRVMGEVAASFISAFKVTSRLPMNKTPGVGEIQLALVEQPSGQAFNNVNTGSRVRYLIDKLTDSELQECVNSAWSQAAVWNDDEENGKFILECFVRAESMDSESMILTYKFVTGSRESE